MITEKLKGKKHRISLFSRFENRENNVIFPFSLFKNREEKNRNHVIFFRGKIGKKKTYPKGYNFPFPASRRSRGKVVVRKLSHDDSFP